MNTHRRKMKISTKMLLIFIGLVLFQAVISIVILSVLISNTNTDTLKTQLARALVGVQGYLDEIIKDQRAKADLFAGQKKVIDYTDFGLKNLLRHDLSLLIDSMRVDGMAIYEKPDVLYLSIGMPQTTDSRFATELAKAFGDAKTVSTLKTDAGILLCVLSPIKRGEEVIAVAVLYLEIDREFVIRLERIINLKVVFTLDGHFISDESLPAESLNAMFAGNAATPPADMLISEHPDFIIGTILMPGLAEQTIRIYCLLETLISAEQIRKYTLISLLLSVLILTAAIAVGFIFYRITFLKPFQTLMRGIKTIADWKFHPPFPSVWKDEFGELALAFNELCIDLARRDAELSRLSQYNALILENIVTGIITVNLDGIVTTCNKSAEDILETEAKRVLGKNIRRDHLPKKFTAVISRDLSSDSYSLGKEIVLAHGQSRRILLLTTTPLLDQDKRRIGLIALLEDITKVKKLEEKLLISSRLAAIGEMAASVAHQIRNPLGVMRVSVEMLRDDYTPTRKAADFKKLTKFLLDEIGALNHVIKDFLDFSRPLNIKLNRCRVEEIIRFSIQNIPWDAFPGITIDVTIDENLTTFSMDKNLMIQALSNVILNALQASRPPSRVELRVFPLNGRLVFEIQDWGRGMTAAVKRDMFNPFFTTREKGIGLGLSIVHRIIENHNGAIEAVSAPGKGTTFTITL